ncbi:hypothetical protein BANRA_05464 [Escherichia coli]|uniref:DUF1281 domain-containing protein n=1 Tax=Escherichia coli TaxID=562 RepID=A0A3P5HE31_ECOLX|nr:hypothetical protein BANRA_05464 [Escherichia coli]
MYRCGGTVCVTTYCRKTMPFDLLTVLPTRPDVEVNGFNGGVLNGVPSAYHWYTEQYGVKWPVGYEVNISSQETTSFRLISTRRGVSRKATLLQNCRRFSCTLEHWYAEQGCDFCGWQLYERGAR